MALKFDNTNSLNTPKPRSKTRKTKSRVNTNQDHIVGVRIDTKAKNTKKKIYYYKTSENYKKGDVIRVKVPSGGTPKSTIVVENSTKKQRYRIKDLKETR